MDNSKKKDLMEETAVLTANTAVYQFLKKDLLDLSSSPDRVSQVESPIRADTNFQECLSEEVELPYEETPDEGGFHEVKVATHTDRRGPESADLTPDEIAEFQALFVKEANLFGWKYLSRLGRDTTIAVRSKEEFSEHILRY